MSELSSPPITLAVLVLSNADALDKSLDMKRTEVREDLSNFSRTFYESIELIRILKYTVLP
jgi:hypothetical protein